jgi:hypothetical protein
VNSGRNPSYKNKEARIFMMDSALPQNGKGEKEWGFVTCFLVFGYSLPGDFLA